jgi:ribosome recycling factor
LNESLTREEVDQAVKLATPYYEAAKNEVQRVLGAQNSSYIDILSLKTNEDNAERNARAIQILLDPNFNKIKEADKARKSMYGMSIIFSI